MVKRTSGILRNPAVSPLARIPKITTNTALALNRGFMYNDSIRGMSEAVLQYDRRREL